MAKCGRPPVLDEAKKREILAIVAVGCSRSMAATYVGCAISTIQNTAERDPTFAEKLRQAVYSTELGLLKNIRNAAKKEQYWRAAAWALERRFPERYARRGPTSSPSNRSRCCWGSSATSWPRKCRAAAANAC